MLDKIRTRIAELEAERDGVERQYVEALRQALLPYHRALDELRRLVAEAEAAEEEAHSKPRFIGQ